MLSESELTFARALEISQGMEAADRNTQQLKGPEAAIQVVTRSASETDNSKLCYRCGRSNHTSEDCRFKEVCCHNCGKKGHIAKVCRAKDSSKRSKRSFRQQHRTKWVQVQQDEASGDSDTSLPLLRIGSRSAHPIMVDVELNDKKLTMEVDTGATVSVISEETLGKLFPDATLQRTTVVLRTYTGETMTVTGQLDVQVRYGPQKQRLPLLIVAGKGPSLFGRNWLQSIRLDWKTIGLVTLDKGQAQVQVLLQKYEEVFAKDLGTMHHFQASLKVQRDSKPLFYKPRPVPFALKEALGKELDGLENEGILEKVTYSAWASPIVPVPKGDGHIRICGDYKVTVNKYLDVEQYPLPKSNELFASLAGGQKFTKLDLTQAYQQMRLDDDSRQFVTINTHQGLYRYTRLPFGNASAPAIFQRTMDTILQGVPHTLCYIDDILITGESTEEHLRNLEEVLKRLRHHHIRAKQKKCFFLQDSVEFLGHCVDAQGLHTSPAKVEAIQMAPRPCNQRQLRSFLGLVQYYGKFIPNLSSLLHPLHALLLKNARWRWSQECSCAFQQAKEMLMSATVLAHYDPQLPLRLAGDASTYGVGAVISHVYPDGSERPIAYASRTLSTSEQKYAQLEKEALSLVFGVRRFHQYLYGRRFTLYTDHKPLTTILGPTRGIPSLAAARLQRWALLLSAYNYEVVFKPTRAHANVDGLSRLPLPNVNQSEQLQEPSIFNIRQMEALLVTAMQLKAATRRDPILSRVMLYTKEGWPAQISDALKPYWNRQTELTLEDECVLWGIRVVVPQKLREPVLQELHHTHPGIVRMKSIARSYVWWPRLDQEIEAMARSCSHCQAVRNVSAVAPLHPWLWPSKPWQRIHVDFASPFRGRNFLVWIDAHSKWPEVIEMKSTTTSATIRELRRLFSAYGLPDQLVSDNGPQFTSEDF